MVESKTAIEILRKFYGSNVGVILVEAIPSEVYLATIRDVQEHFARLEKPISRDFLEMLLEDSDSIWESLRKSQNQFVYNLDLFGQSIDPEKATQVMGCMRSVKDMGRDIKQLMIARPEANLDYNSRKGYTYHDNHPLENWCQFYRFDGETIAKEQNPIRHRDNTRGRK